MPKATHARDARRFTDIPNVGPAMAKDFAQLGFAKPAELAGQDALALYRRLCVLTRARQGMVIFVPPGEKTDPTRSPGFYDPTFKYLTEIGIPTLT